ncbi:hypothetical protein DPEC_G00217020 [Dallia pectoralis]|uniref:Uncharacterized protein n=1 Tax=Dallia pectoralis TaxID=75939 RepID=A0ACC2G2Y3_DALPE|nr:hypothetical protein DPEC_G00217020 [Dallia pectoralis]
MQNKIIVQIIHMDHKIEAVLKILVDQYNPNEELIEKPPPPPPRAPCVPRAYMTRGQSSSYSFDDVQ